MVNKEELYKTACEAIDASAADLHQLSDLIWQTPELNYEEHEAHKNLTQFLEKKGFTVERGYKTPTAFRSDYGKGNVCVAILCEYDALPEIGHACGHNLIAEAGIGASLGVKAATDKAGMQLGKLVVLGTPAEEGGGGKMVLIDEGAFNDVDCALMVHPTPWDVTRPGQLAILQVRICFHGKASHASGFPWEGINALDAAVLAYNNVSCMRQQIKPTWKINGVITNGGAKPNIIPEFTEMEYYIRAPVKNKAKQLRAKLVACAEGAAKATGCEVMFINRKVDIQYTGTPYDEVLHNSALCERYEAHLTSMGVKYSQQMPGGGPAGGSTDMGNVSYTVPSIHPFYSIDSTAINHTREFTAAAGDHKAQKPTLIHAKVMAKVAIDVMCDQKLVTAMKEDFRKDLSVNYLY